MTFTTFRNPCTDQHASITVLESFIEARQFAIEHPEMIEAEVEATSHDEAYAMAYEEFVEARDTYLASLYGDIY